MAWRAANLNARSVAYRPVKFSDDDVNVSEAATRSGGSPFVLFRGGGHHAKTALTNSWWTKSRETGLCVRIP